MRDKNFTYVVQLFLKGLGNDTRFEQVRSYTQKQSVIFVVKVQEGIHIRESLLRFCLPGQQSKKVSWNVGNKLRCCCSCTVKGQEIVLRLFFDKDEYCSPDWITAIARLVVLHFSVPEESQQECYDVSSLLQTYPDRKTFEEDFVKQLAGWQKECEGAPFGICCAKHRFQRLLCMKGMFWEEMFFAYEGRDSSWEKLTYAPEYHYAQALELSWMIEKLSTALEEDFSQNAEAFSRMCFDWYEEETKKRLFAATNASCGLFEHSYGLCCVNSLFCLFYRTLRNLWAGYFEDYYELYWYTDETEAFVEIGSVAGWKLFFTVAGIKWETFVSGSWKNDLFCCDETIYKKRKYHL